jgi:hypothetical protein
MISAYVEQVKPIPARIVESVSSELLLDEQPFVTSPLAMSGLPEEILPAIDQNAQSSIEDAANYFKEREL